MPTSPQFNWIVPPAADQPAIARGLEFARTPALATHTNEWTPIPTTGGRVVLRRIHDQSADYLKWFPAAGFSVRRRTGPFWPSPAHRHVEWSRTLESLGVRISPLITAGCAMHGPFLGHPDSFIITRSPLTARTLGEIAHDQSITPEQRARIASELRDLARRLHDRGIGRLDLRAPNVLIYSPHDPPVLFDLDRLMRLGPIGRRARIEKDLSRVRASCELLLQGRPA